MRQTPEWASRCGFCLYLWPCPLLQACGGHPCGQSGIGDRSAAAGYKALRGQGMSPLGFSRDPGLTCAASQTDRSAPVWRGLRTAGSTRADAQEVRGKSQAWRGSGVKRLLWVCGSEVGTQFANSAGGHGRRACRGWQRTQAPVPSRVAGAEYC